MKVDKQFRNYVDSERQDMVRNTYKTNHVNMTVKTCSRHARQMAAI